MGTTRKPVCVGIGQVWSGQRKRCGRWVVVGLGNLSSINKCLVKKTVSNPNMIADRTKVIFAT